MIMRPKGFSLLEMVVAMALFSIIGLTLYSLFHLLTQMQTASLGMNHFKNEGYQVLDYLEFEIKTALQNPVSIYPPGTAFDENISNVTIQPQFLVLAPADSTLAGAPGIFISPVSSPAMSGVSQLHFLKQKYAYTQNLITTNVFWDQTYYNEMIVYLKEDKRLFEYKRSSQNLPHQVDGLADNVLNGSGDEIARNIENIEYFLWGQSSLSWSNDGSGSNTPIREWNSLIAENNGIGNPIHAPGQLPMAMKIVLTMIYNPERDHKRQEDIDNNVDNVQDKSQRIVFERIIFFKDHLK